MGCNFPMFGELDVLDAKVAKGKNFDHISPCSVKCLVKIVDSKFVHALLVRIDGYMELLS